jgi:hypothetical protein
MAKMLSRTSGLVHPRKIVTGTTTNIDEDLAALRNTTVLAKSRLVPVATMVITTAMITAGAVSSEVTIEMRLILVGRAIIQVSTSVQHVTRRNHELTMLDALLYRSRRKEGVGSPPKRLSNIPGPAKDHRKHTS